MSYRPPKPTLFDYIGYSASRPAVDGVPCVSDLPSDVIEQDGKPYMRRYYLLGQHNHTGGSTARYHQILESDKRILHDHPWDFVSVILSGSYVETTPDAEQEYGPGSVLVRTAEQLHRLTLPAHKPVWTLVVLGPARRQWGFVTDEDGWVDWRSYLAAQDAPNEAGDAWAL